MRYEDVEVLRWRLNHGLALRLREEDILPAIKGLYSQIKGSYLIQDYFPKESSTGCTPLPGIYVRQLYQDSKKDPDHQRT